MMKKRMFSGILSIITACVLLSGGILSGFRSYASETEGSVDKSALTELIGEAEKLSTDGYSAESIAFFQAAIASAKEVEENESATEQQVKKQTNLLTAVSGALVQKEDSSKVYNGTYTINGVLRHASSDQNSMGNAAIVKPMELIVSGSSVTLRMEFQALTTKLGSSSFTGYLAEFYYFPDYDKDTIPTDQTRVSAKVESYYDGVYDSYNNAKTGTDSRVKGKLYPHYMTMPVELNDAEIWTQVYVPVMESVTAGSGEQYARLQLDWSTLKQVSGTDADKSTLETRISDAETLLASLKKDSQGFSSKTIVVLQAAVTAGRAVDDSMNYSQSAVNATSRAILQTINVFRDTDEDVDKSALKIAISLADSYLAKDSSKYTETAWALLEAARDYAKELYNNVQASQEAVDQQTSFLNYAVENLKASVKTSDSGTGSSSSGSTGNTGSGNSSGSSGSSSGSSGSSSSSSSSGSSSSSKTSSKLDVNSLADGVYAVTGSLVKIDKKTSSMADNAISHTIKLTVKSGKYYLTMDFTGLEINSQYGYLSKLKYFKTGYTLDKYGAPSGTTKAVTVDSYQTDSSGKKVKDSLGTDYPKQVTFPMISEAKSDGYVPLQVYVPIMESISAGSGTQPVFLKLDWSTLKKSSSDNDAFTDHSDSSGSSSGSSSSGDSLSSGSSLGTSGSLGNNTLPGIGDGDDSLLEGEGLDAGTALSTDGGVQETAADAESVTASASGGSSSESSAATTVPAVMSILAALAGVIYKIKSRNIISSLFFR